jgi:acyl-CoA thioesterase-2
MMPAVVAYLSDYLMINAALIPHVAEIPDERLFVASINHSIWFHAPADPSQWLLYDIVSPWAGQGRALCIGYLYRKDGGMVASVAQEAMVRPLRTSAVDPEGVQPRS